jgi:hypothetical protein
MSLELDELSKASYAKDGFVILKNAIPEDLIDTYVDILSGSLVEDDNGKLRGWEGKTSYLGAEEALDILCHPSIQSAFEDLNKGIALHIDIPYWVSTEKNWHQDAVLANPIAGDNYLGVWVALEDVDPDAGPFEMIPGSHLWDLDFESIYLSPENNFSPRNEEEKNKKPVHIVLEEEMIKRNSTEIVSFTAEKGDVLIWHGRLIHRGSMPNNKNLTRKSLIGHYCNMYANTMAKVEAPAVASVIDKMKIDPLIYSQWKNGGYYFVDPENVEKAKGK